MKQGFQDRLKQSIESRGLSQRMLATLIGTSEQSICRYLKGKRLPGADILYRICKALGVSADYLLGLDENEGIYKVKYERLKGKLEELRSRCFAGAEKYFDGNQIGLIKIVTISEDRKRIDRLLAEQRKEIKQDLLVEIKTILECDDGQDANGADEPEKAGGDTAGRNQETV